MRKNLKMAKIDIDPISVSLGGRVYAKFSVRTRDYLCFS
jgi:hypothetical protein